MKISINRLFKISAILSAAILATTFSISCASYPLKNIVILYTNDVHGHFCEEGKIDYSNLKSIKDDFIQDGNDVLLLDAGDHLSGCLNGSFDKGVTILKTMNDVGYDAATLGNHEFDFGMEYLKDYTKKQNFPYLSTNLYNLNNGQLADRVVEPSKIFNLQNQKIGVVGISTPDTIGVCAPKSFQNDEGDYIYSFLASDDGTTLYNNIQDQVDYLKGVGCKYVIALSHLGYDKGQEDYKYSSPAVIKHTSGIDILIDGHTHNNYLNDVFTNKNGENVYCTQSGSFFDRVGKIKITPNGEITIDSIEEYSKYDEKIRNYLNDYIDTIHNTYGKTIAFSKEILFERKKKKGSNLIDLGADAFYYGAIQAKERHDLDENLDIIAFPNTGGFRVKTIGSDDTGATLNWSYETCLTIFPFYNQFIIRKMKGEAILRAIEFAVRMIDNSVEDDERESLFFPAGLKCDIDASVKTEFELDGKNYKSGPTTAARKVSNAQVYNISSKTWKNIVDTDYYYVAGADYLVLNGGDGTTMFTEDSVTTAYVGSQTEQYEDYYDYQVFANYLKSFTKEGDYPKISNSGSYYNGFTNYLIDYESEKGSHRFNIKNEIKE